MKQKLLVLLAITALAFAGTPALADEPAGSGLRAETMPVIQRIQEKLKQGKDTEADLAVDLKAIDELIAGHRNDADREGVASLYLLKTQIYLQVLENDVKAAELLNRVKQDFAGTEAARESDALLAQLKAQAAMRQIRKSLAPKTLFPDFTVKDLAGRPLSVANYRGKVVLLDFWATWCGPCRAELPNVKQVYQTYHDKGFEIIGISLDSDRAALESFIKAKDMPWAQYFDGLGWRNPLAAKYGVNSIPSTILIDGNGKIIAQDLRGEQLAAAVARALATQ